VEFEVSSAHSSAGRIVGSFGSFVEIDGEDTISVDVADTIAFTIEIDLDVAVVAPIITP